MSRACSSRRSTASLVIRWALVTAAFSGLLAVALGAFGAHALENVLDARGVDVFDTASRYHFVHTFALALAALAPTAGASRRACRAAGVVWLAGMIVFSGSLYALALTGIGWLGAITPFGGVALMVGWFLLAAAAARGPDVTP